MYVQCMYVCTGLYRWFPYFHNDVIILTVQ